VKHPLDVPFFTMMPVVEFGGPGPSGIELGFFLRQTTLRTILEMNLALATWWFR
jgi:hypothetical protein